MQLKELKKLVNYAKKANIQRIKVNNIEIDFHEKAFVSKGHLKVFENLVNPSKSETEEEYRSDLFFSA